MLHLNETRAQEKKHLASLIALTESHDDEIANAKKKTKKKAEELEKLEVEFAENTKQMENKHMAALITGLARPA